MPIVELEKPQHKSTHIAGAAFIDDGTGNGRGKLRVQFIDGATGEYDDVPRAVFDALMRDKSPGSFLHKQVKDFFTWRKLNLRYAVRLEIHEIETDPASSAGFVAGNVDSPDPWTVCACATLKDAIAYRNGMTVMSEVVNEHLQKEPEDSATAETPAPATQAQSDERKAAGNLDESLREIHQG